MFDIKRIPFLDLIAPHEELRDELVSVFRTALSSAAFIGGPVVEAFERKFACFCETEHCIGVSSGTDALRFALIAAGIRCDDIVVTVPNTFIATAEAISQAGARPVFVDVDERTYTMAPERLREYLESGCFIDGESGYVFDKNLKKRVAAVVPVHLYGQPADMDSIMTLAEQYNLTVIEDACQAHGAAYFSQKDECWKKAGSMGHAAAFSFYPGKNLGACGEGGAVTTNDAELARTVRMLRDHGQTRKYYHEIEGFNGRLDAIQAGILDVKLKGLVPSNELRRKRACDYRDLFRPACAEIGLPYEPFWARGVYHLYVVRVQHRDEVQQDLESAGIGTGVHYPVPVHLQGAYASLGYSVGQFPIAEQLANELLSLPMYPSLSCAQQKRISQELISSINRRRMRALGHSELCDYISSPCVLTAKAECPVEDGSHIRAEKN